MTRARPCLGYPSRSAAILALKAKGQTEREIAQRLGIKPNTVSSLAARHRARATTTLVLSVNLFEDLRKLAWARSTTPQALAARLLTIVVAERLTAAVLDD